MQSFEDLSLHELVAKNYVRNLTFKLSTLRLNIDERDEFNKTPLHVAARSNRGKSHFKVAEILLNNGADPNAADSYEITPLWLLVQNSGEIDILKLFFKFIKDLRSLSQHRSLLIPAINTNNLDVLKFLVQDIGLDVNPQTEKFFGITPLHYATAQNTNDSHYEMLKFLLEMGSEVNARDSEGKTPLYNVIKSGNLRVFELFLSYKAELRMSRNILSEFVKNNSDVKVLEKLFLLSNSEDLSLNVNQKDADGLTPLHHAVIGNYCSRSKPINMKFIKCLLKNGANINALDDYGITPLENAVPKISKLFAKDEKKASNFADFLFEQADFSVKLKKFQMIYRVDELILKHLAKLKFLNIPVHSSLQKHINDRTECKDYFVKCTKELEIMSSTKPQNSWINFINLLVDDRKKLKNYAGNEDLIEDYKYNDWGKIFPIYGDSLKRNFDKGFRRRELFDKSSILLSDCLPIFSSNHLIVKDILDCILSKKDLPKFLCE